MVGDARSRYEIVNELANKRIELIGQLGALKSKEAEWKGQLKRKKMVSERKHKEIEASLPQLIKANKDVAEQKERTYALTKKSYEKDVASLIERQKQDLENQLEQIKSYKDEKTLTENNKNYLKNQIKVDTESLEDDTAEVEIKVLGNNQAIVDVADKIKSIDLALEAIKSISANNEKSKE